jgi:hypothetical protein
MQLISYADMIRQMNHKDKDGTPTPFSLKVVTLDINRKTGGDILSIPAAIIDRQKAKAQKANSRTPRHYENRTRNIKIVSSGEIRKIHPRLIIEFNNKTVFH